MAREIDPTRPDDEDRTDPELIRRAGEREGEGPWFELVARYDGLIRNRCRRPGIQPHALDELAQSVWVKVFKTLPKFAYDPTRSFRCWLACIADGKVVEYFRRLGRKPATVPVDDLEPHALELPTTIPLASSGRREPDILASRAVAVVQVSLHKRSWEAFERVAVHGEPLPDVARDLGMKYSAAYMAVARTRRKLRDQILWELSRQ